MTEKIPYWKSNRFLGAFVRKEGDEGCRVCTDERIKLSLDRPPPQLRDQPPKPKAVVEKKKKDDDEFLMNVIGGIHKVVDAKRKFSAWLDNADGLFAAAAKKGVVKGEEKIPSFDIQEIPGAIRAMGMPKAARVFDKWFAGGLNYSPDDESSRLEINQNGEPYPVSMVDRTSISLEWVLQFHRAKIQFELVQTQALLTTQAALKALKAVLSRYKNVYDVRSELVCDGDIQAIHRLFQFQLVSVEGSLGQKIDQFLTREVLNRGLPDELTMIMGSFNFYAAVSRARYGQDSGGQFAVVTHIYLYAKDAFTFTDEKGKPSQYLGHWNRDGVGIAPIEAAMGVAKMSWVDRPIFQDIMRGNFKVMYPVKNSDFRNWQLKHRQGGDYIIYTDKRGVMLRFPLKIYLQ